MTGANAKIKRIYVGEKQVRPYRTFTIQRTEKSDMSSGWTYSDNASGLTAGSTEFDKFFGYYGCRLSTSGAETAKITQEESGGYGKLDITQLGTLSSGDNVMICFPRRGIKMSKSGTQVTLSITEDPNKEGYQYYAFQTGTLSNPGTAKDKVYIGTYKGYITNNVLKSWSTGSPTTSYNMNYVINYAKANGTGHDITGFYQRMYINALYMMKYGNPNSQSVVGKGYVGGSGMTYNGGTDGQINATYGTSSNSEQVKLFGLEGWWGNSWEWVGGCYASGELYTGLATNTNIEGTGTTIVATADEISSIAGNNKAMFIPTGCVSNSSYDTYYSDYAYAGNGMYGVAGDTYNGGNSAGVFTMFFNFSSGNSGFSGRLMYL